MMIEFMFHAECHCGGTYAVIEITAIIIAQASAKAMSERLCASFLDLFAADESLAIVPTIFCPMPVFVRKILHAAEGQAILGVSHFVLCFVSLYVVYFANHWPIKHQHLVLWINRPSI